MTTHEPIEERQDQPPIFPTELIVAGESELSYDEEGQPKINEYDLPSLSIEGFREKDPQLGIGEVLHDVYSTLPNNLGVSISPRLAKGLSSMTNALIYDHRESFFAYIYDTPEELEKEQDPSLAERVTDYRALFDPKTGLPIFRTGPINQEGEHTATVRDLVAATIALAHKHPEDLVVLLEPFEVLEHYDFSWNERRLLTEFGEKLTQTEKTWLAENAPTLFEWLKPPLEVYMQDSLVVMTIDGTIDEIGPSKALDMIVDETAGMVDAPQGIDYTGFLDSIREKMLDKPDYLARVFGNFYPIYVEKAEAWQRKAIGKVIMEALTNKNSEPNQEQIGRLVATVVELYPNTLRRFKEIQSNGPTKYLEQQ